VAFKAWIQNRSDPATDIFLVTDFAIKIIADYAMSVGASGLLGSKVKLQHALSSRI
jgi:hypothetical protein